MACGGDMAAVVKAILLDEEARNCYGNTQDVDSKLKEPFVRYIHIMRHLPKLSTDVEYCCADIFYKKDEFPQYIFNSPSVFNFFQPHYAPNGGIANQNLVAPEFQIHNSLSSIDYINFINRILSITCDDNLDEPTMVLLKEYSAGEYINYTTVDMDYYINLAKDTEALINEVDRYFAQGKLSHQTRIYIREALSLIDENYYNNCDFNERELKNKVVMALYIIAISPDYAIIR